jgi:hypothetical protein
VIVAAEGIEQPVKVKVISAIKGYHTLFVKHYLLDSFYYTDRVKCRDSTVDGQPLAKVV